ncbi:DSD1 family PLP-dependent enzyme [Legionella fallonii]|uniref:Metal-activated pyridoxal enzyme n=1 Tax=Legionella fallonii LLAP-10 TaxID=1212491 RepID=A0A098G4J4_9GAMM|nr:DSD1 family PLP-dependent enzyme [Legionella fallonii]CEG56891.1 Metal-activated pyridoxal enzyme [Legionella fallonii LLAP-10]
MNNFNIKKSQLDTPCLIIDKQTLISNLELMRAHGIKNNVSIRPHVKTHKCTELAKLQIEYGAIGISAAKISEAEELINKGIRNVLITSPIVTKEKIRRLISCIQQAPDTIIVVDNEHNLNDLNEAANAISFKINVLVDIDPGIGRTGVNPDLALDFALKTNNFNSLNLMGIQCYAGNLQHISSYEERKNSSLNIMRNASNIAQIFREHGLNCSIVTGAGTGTYDIDIEAGVTEIQPGSYTVMDVEYSVIGSKENSQCFHTFKPAMTLLTTVISSNRKEHVTVDAGTKSIYVDKKHRPLIISHNDLEYDWGGFGDEHGKITALNNASLPTNGEILELIVPHCDPTINLFDKFYIVENDKVIDIWDIDLRGKSQ